MKVAVDLDGTAWRFPQIFIPLIVALRAAGHPVGVLTGHMDHIRDEDLRLWRARGYPEIDFFLNASDAERVGIVHARPQREWKPELASKNGIDLIIDDFEGGPMEMHVIKVAA